MTVLAYIEPIKKWILVHETPIGNSSSYGQNYPVKYKLADSPLDMRFSEDTLMLVDNKTVGNASPYVVWSPVGGPLGTIVVSDADHQQVFTNRFGGDADKWELHATPAGAVYSRAIQIFKKRPDHLLIYGGQTYNDSASHTPTPFSATVVNLNDVLRAPETEPWETSV